MDRIGEITEIIGKKHYRHDDWEKIKKDEQSNVSLKSAQWVFDVAKQIDQLYEPHDYNRGFKDSQDVLKESGDRDKEPQPDRCSECGGTEKDYRDGGFDGDFADCPKCKPNQLGYSTVAEELAYHEGEQDTIKRYEACKPDQSSRLLTPEEQDACTPTKEQLDAYLAEPDDEVAAKIRVEHPEKFREIGRAILYGKNIAKAQDAKTASIKDAEIAALIESRKRDYKMLADWVDRCEITLSDTNMSNALVRDGLLNISKYLKANPTSEVEG